MAGLLIQKACDESEWGAQTTHIFSGIVFQNCIYGVCKTERFPSLRTSPGNRKKQNPKSSSVRD